MTQTINHEIVDTPTGKLKSHPRNPRQGDVGAIVASIQANGFYGAIVAQKSTGHILAGNHRWQAAKHLKIPKVPVAYVDVDDATALRILLADNRTNDLATYDEAELTKLLAEILDSAGTLTGTGYDADDLDDLLRDTAPDIEAIKEDPVPPVPEDPTTKPGDVWTLGKHRLVCGDSTIDETYQTLLGDETTDLLFTDPPYNVEYVGKTENALTIKNDKHTDAGFLAFLVDAFTASSKTMRAGAPAYVFHADSNGLAFREAFTTAGLSLKQVLVWIKNSFVLGRQDYQWQHEPILYGWKPGAAHTWTGEFDKSTLLDGALDPASMKRDELLALVQEALEESTAIREKRPQRNAEHPTMKPVKLCARLIDNSSRYGAIVLEPFAGGGLR